MFAGVFRLLSVVVPEEGLGLPSGVRISIVEEGGGGG